MTVLFIDFETRSTVDLKSAGLDNYAKHSTTDVWCMGWARGDEPVSIWTPELFSRTAKEVASALDGRVVVAHNAAFELAIWNHIMAPRYGWPVLKPEQCVCTMAMAYAMALPGSLEKAAAAVGLEAQKDKSGHRLMLQMASPRKLHSAADAKKMLTADWQGYQRFEDGTVALWWDEPDKLQALYEYCRQDVKVERDLWKRLSPLSASEQAMWVLDQKINQRGVYVDRHSVSKAVAVVQVEADRLNNEMREATGGAVSFCTETARLGQWVRGRGVSANSVAKADVANALGSGDLPADVRRALLIRQEAGKTSTAKLRAMLDAVSSDGRLRGMLQYHGAATGRWAGRRVQLQNIPRWPQDFGEEDAERCLAALSALPAGEAGDYLRLFYGSPMTVISYLLRPLLRAAPGNELLAADFASIESRGLAWLAGEEWKLKAFRAFDAGEGDDMYKLAYGRAYSVPPGDVTKDQRQIGKVMELACGYGGGQGALRKMAKAYGVKMDAETAEDAKDAWRLSNLNVRQYWYDLDDAFKQAIRSPSLTTQAGAEGREVKFRMKGSFLWCRLPSKRLLCYPYPRLDRAHTFELEDGRTVKYSARRLAKEGPPKDAKETRIDHGTAFYMRVDGLSNKWGETDTYGGKLSENVTQAICRDLLAEAIKRCEARGYDVVLHVHDEIVVEVPAGDRRLPEFEALCADTSDWAEGLPVVAAGWRGERYRK